MRIAAAIALVLCGLATAAPARADDTALAAPIEQCIRSNAIKVASAVPNLNEAVDFLVEKICAKPIADEAAVQQANVMKQYSDRLRKNCDTWKAAHPNTDAASVSGNDESYNPCQLADTAGDSGGINWTIFAGRTPSEAPPAAVALAAQLLLDQRLAHMNQTH
ncbi:MAG: hypothetical protein ISS15_08265 [Alphaproteobacteria bacterium]|nr:hypothetical protein [Alphaproteobacteria bacterium]MBL6936866.1 hypothetical protein [Alphaproteobacteria bacterium]MBL7097635.1 hypothetical protein [Alphaproteobacteria bacterium]